MMYRKINPDTGLFIADEIHDARPLLESGEPDPAYVETPVPPDAGLYWPRWNGSSWVEGRTPEEIAAIMAAAPPPEPTQEERLAALEAAMLEMILGGGTGG